MAGPAEVCPGLYTSDPRLPSDREPSASAHGSMTSVGGSAVVGLRAAGQTVRLTQVSELGTSAGPTVRAAAPFLSRLKRAFLPPPPPQHS